MSLILSCHITQSVRNTFRHCIKLKIVQRKVISRCITTNGTKSKFVPFMEMINERRAEASRTILVQVQSAQSFKELHAYCNSVGKVKDMQHYTVGVEPMNFIIVEFESESDVQNILADSSHMGDTQIVPVHSQFLWFRAANRKGAKMKTNKPAALTLENGSQKINDGKIREAIGKCDTVSDQMETLYTTSRIDDMGVRLKFLTARQIEVGLKGLFPHAAAFPFGSSVNGCGRTGCDLDLVLRLGAEEKAKGDTRLVFHCKAVSGTERSSAQRNMETIGNLIQLFLPGCAQVRRILQARIPIIKYYQQLTDVECDLSMSNMSGVYMSDFLYIMGSIDARVRPLIFTVRRWASDVGLTNSSPGRWLTNFSLTLLVLSFLQKPPNSPPVLPTLNALIQKARPADAYVTEDGINCTFLRDIKLLAAPTANSESLEALLREFFEFYAQFDFQTRAVCLNEAVSITKPEHCALYIVNPLERGLNVSKNVSLEEVERFRVECRNAAWLLESLDEGRGGNWGILSIFENRRKGVAPVGLVARNSRMMEVSTLFQEEVEFKNEGVKRQVKAIDNERKAAIEEMRKLNR